MNVLAFNGSPRRNGNTSILLSELLRGAESSGAQVEEIIADQINLNFCTGCLRCNMLKRCAVQNDAWEIISQKILAADALVFGSPVYFHHVSAQLKKIIDRFRSFIHVQITEEGLKHTPWHSWEKKFVLLLCLGSSVNSDAQPVIDLFKFFTKELGEDNQLTTLVGTRLAITKQVQMSQDELNFLYPKLGLPL